ncbi:MAG TPA: tRNA lysidine(34) synthetase TilS [Chitinophagaceae bacterium]|nr:tRNA lysidine(34) synthetase TilS [Chitinophagaceae bacterium]
MLQQFISFLKEKNLLQPQHHFLVAASGGIDSVVLCALCKEANLSFSIIHCNFHLRAAESNRDEEFVRSLGVKYDVAVFVKDFDALTFAEQNRLSIQEAARVLRYNWFAAIREKRKAAYTLLAHHATDDVETLLMNFFRGTGLEGLTGMPWNVETSHCLRPLLKNTRKDIEDYAETNKLDWVEDSSNALNKYTRNFFRNDLIPALQKVYPQVEENLINNINRFKKTNNLYKILVQELKQKLNKGAFPQIRYPVKQLLNYSHTSLIYEIIKDFGFGEKQVPEVLKLCSSESGKYIENEGHQVIKHRAWLIIAPKSVQATAIAIEKGETEIRFNSSFLEIKKLRIEKLQLQKNAAVAQLDASKIEYPLLLRKWKEGDYFYPLGMAKKKKLSRFFIDLKLPKNEKENIWVLESAKRIIWVIGYRIDDRYKITERTKEVLQITKTFP